MIAPVIVVVVKKSPVFCGNDYLTKMWMAHHIRSNSFCNSIWLNRGQDNPEGSETGLKSVLLEYPHSSLRLGLVSSYLSGGEDYLLE